MELIDNLNPVKLKRFLHSIDNELNAPFNDEKRPIRGFNIISKKNELTQLMITEVLLNQFSNEQDDSQFILLFDLTFSWNFRSSYYNKIKSLLTPSQFERLVIINDIDTLDELIQSLRDVKNYEFNSLDIKFDYLSKRLSLVIIDNVSVFNFTSIQNGTYPMELKSLYSLIKIIEIQYNCCSIITSFDKNFELGLDLSNQENNTLRSVTTIPLDLFTRNVYYLISKNPINNLINGKYFCLEDDKVYIIRSSELKN